MKDRVTIILACDGEVGKDETMVYIKNPATKQYIKYYVWYETIELDDIYKMLKFLGIGYFIVNTKYDYKIDGDYTEIDIKDLI